MRISLYFCMVVYSLVSCGTAENRYHIDETSSQNQYAKSGIAFHSTTGWTSVVAFYVESQASDTIIEASVAAAETWNDAVGYEVLSFVGVTESERGDNLYDSLDDTDTIIYYEEEWIETTDKASTTLATTVWENAPSSDEIVKADIIMNAEVYLFQDATKSPLEPERSDFVVDAETVILHEFGHLLGLDHVSIDDDENSIMHAKTFIGPYMYTHSLSEGDTANIQELYN